MNVFSQHNDVHCGAQSGEEADPAPETVMEQSSFFLSLKSLRFQICLQDEQASAFCCSFKFFRFQKEKFEHRQDDQQATGLEQQRLVVVICCVYICKWTLERYLTDRLDRNLTNIIDTSNFLPADHLQTQSGHIKCLLCQLQVLDSLVTRFQLVIFSSR